MDQRRFWLFLVFSMGILWVWQLVVLPRVAPPPKKPDLTKAAQDLAAAAGDKKSDTPVAKPDAPVQPPRKLPTYPVRQDVQIGALDPNTGYRLFVEFDSRGAVPERISLSDRHYHDLSRQKNPLAVLSSDDAGLRSLELEVPEIDAVLAEFKTSLRDVNWEVLPGSQKEDSVTWRFLSPDGELEVRKNFFLKKETPDSEAPAYQLNFDVVLLNHSDKAKTASYTLVGPTGLVLDNPDYTTKTRDVVAGFHNGDKQPLKTISPLLGSAIEKRIKNQQEEEWTSPIQFIGVDAQYFTALIVPQEDQSTNQYYKSSKAIFAGAPQLAPYSDVKYRDVSVLLSSKTLDIPAAKDKQPGQVTHKLALFTGPKVRGLLEPIQAISLIVYGISGTLGIPQGMLALLEILGKVLGGLPWSYGWSIILLTIIVRSCMFPLSRKQALSAAKMQELQPEIQALRKKFEKTPDKLGPEIMALYRKNGVNPLGGCLPVFIQLPIFIGLYQALSISVEMRGAPFLYISNLAAPDALFHFPFRMPFLGPSFNLLPMLTVGLFLLQQILYMPPATTEEEKMQHMMFKGMTVFMGFLFYSSPAGFCLYFIASSLWSIAERKLLPKSKKATVIAAEDGGGGDVVQTTATRK